MRPRVPATFFPTLRLDSRNIAKELGVPRSGLNRRGALAEAELFVLNSLRQGHHPDIIDAEVSSEILRNDGSDYKVLFLNYTRRILANLRLANQFGGLPTLVEYAEITDIRGRLGRFQIMMYERFTDSDILRRYGMDREIVREMDAAQALDKAAENTLRDMREQEHKRIEEQYRANEEALRSELADAKFRAESAEARLRFQNTQFTMRPKPTPTFASRNQPAGGDYPPTSVPGPNDRSYTPRDRNFPSDFDRTRSERSFRPGFDDEGISVKQNYETSEPEYRHVDRPRPNRDRTQYQGRLPENSYPDLKNQKRDGNLNRGRTIADTRYANPSTDRATSQSGYSNDRRREPSRSAPENRYPDGPRPQYGVRGEYPPDAGRRRSNDYLSEIGSSRHTSKSSRNGHRHTSRRYEDKGSAPRGPRDDESLRGGRCWTIPSETESSYTQRRR